MSPTTPSQIQNPAGLNLPPTLFGGGLVIPYLEHQPQIGENVFIAPGSWVIGAAKLGDRASVWFGASIRGDINRIEVGAGTNIQDNSVLHVADDGPCLVGCNVVVGHRAILHACTVEDDCLIGMGATVLDYSVIGHNSVIGAGALVTKHTKIPPYSLVIGSPAKVVKTLTPEEAKAYMVYAPKYIRVAENYRAVFANPAAQPL
jgi:gamma-carbonic anhydrase